MLKKIIKNLYKLKYKGKTQHQQKFEKLLHFSLYAQNIGCGGDFEDSGEKVCLEQINIFLSFHYKTNTITLFDIGANVGKYSLLLNKIFDEKRAAIKAFEPLGSTFKELEKNTKGVNNIQCHNFGFGEKEEIVKLYFNSENSVFSSIYSQSSLGFEMKDFQEIKLFNLDSYCTQNEIYKIHFMKLDTEGNEFSILQGAEKMLREARIDFIQFEFGGSNISSRTYFRDYFYFLTNLNYDMYRVVQDGLYKIENYSLSHEIFLVTNFIAVQKELHFKA